MNIVILSASERKNSHTAQTASKIEEYLLRTQSEVHIQMFDQQNIKASHCIGCCECFCKGKCSIDHTDGINDLKEALLKSNLIFVISPVYFHQVSGTMKIFIDRLSYWTHLMRLIGKTSVTVSVSSNNGNEYVNFYLNKFMSALGTIVLSNISILWDEDSPDNAKAKIICGIDEALKKIKKNELTVNQNQEILFSIMREKYKKLQLGAEYEFWCDNHYFDYATFQALWNDHCTFG